MAVNDFDFIAPFYDRLAKLIFGRALLRAQLTHLSELKEKDQVLIVGGGAGELLEHIPFCTSIDFVEKSKRMIRRAKKRLVDRPVNFILEDFLSFESDKKYDVIICPFFLDCFEEQNLKLTINKCKKLLKKEGVLIVSDFEEKYSNKFLLRIMHLFFRVTSRLESNKLKPINDFVVSEGFQLVDEKFLHRNQLFSRLYITNIF